MLFLKIWWHVIAILKKLGYCILYGNRVHFGKGVTFRKGFSMMADGGRIQIGNRVFFNHNCSLTSMEEIVIGDDCIFGENVDIYDHNHRFAQRELIKKQGFSKGGVKIGRNCWIGSNAVILKGAEIGDNVVVGAGCIIDGKIPSDCIVRTKKNYEIEEIRYR